MKRLILLLVINMVFLASQAGHQNKNTIPTRDDEKHTAVVALQLVDDGGRRVLDATVTLTDADAPQDKVSQTCLRSTCSFTGLYPGRYVAVATARDQKSDATSVEAQNDRTTSITLTLK